ncbi:hypothetical protein LTR95_000638 [Oleoguttula sp. CCFEE 5521]
MAANATQLGGVPAPVQQYYQPHPAPAPHYYQPQPASATTTTQTTTATATATPAQPYRVQKLKRTPTAAGTPKRKPQRKTKQPTPEPAKPCRVGTADACNACERCAWWNREVAPFVAELEAFAAQFPNGYAALIAQAQRAAAAPQPYVDDEGQEWTPVRYLGRVPAEEHARLEAPAREQRERREEWERDMRLRLGWSVETELLWWHALEHAGEVDLQQGTEENPVVFEDEMEE